MNNTKHILFISPGFPKDEKDTRCIPAMYLFLLELNKDPRYQLSIVALDYPYNEKSYVWKGLQVYAVGGKNKRYIRKLLLYRKAARLIKGIHARSSIDHVHSFWLGDAAWLGNRLSKSLGIKHSCTLMGQDVLKTNKYVKRIQPFPITIALSQFHLQMFKAHWGKNADHLINWGIEDVSKFKVGEKSIDILGVGNLSDVKAYDRFIKVIASLRIRYPNIRAAIIGEGSEEEQLVKLISEMQLEKNVMLLGVKNREQTLSIMAKSEALLHTSVFESFGLVFLEALALGLKVFSTPVGISEEISEIQKFNNDQELIEKLSDFLESKRNSYSLYPFKIQETTKQYINQVF